MGLLELCTSPCETVPPISGRGDMKLFDGQFDYILKQDALRGEVGIAQVRTEQVSPRG